MTVAPETAPRTRTPARFRRFRLVHGGRDGDHVVAEPPPKQVLLSPGSARWASSLADALGPGYDVTLTGNGTPSAIVIDSRDDELVRLVQEQRNATRVIVVHTGHPSEQPMPPAAILDLGADTYLAPVSLPALAAHVKALTRSWDAFPAAPPGQPASAGQPVSAAGQRA